MTLARNKFDVDEELESPFNLQNLKHCMVYVSRYKRSMILALVLSAVGSVVGLTGPMIIKEALDGAIPDKNIQQLVFLSALLLSTILINILFTLIRSWLMTKVSQSIVHDIPKDLFDHLQVLPFSYYDSRPHGKILVRVVHYVNSVSDTLSKRNPQLHHWKSSTSSSSLSSCSA